MKFKMKIRSFPTKRYLTRKVVILSTEKSHKIIEKAKKSELYNCTYILQMRYISPKWDVNLILEIALYLISTYPGRDKYPDYNKQIVNNHM